MVFRRRKLSDRVQTIVDEMLHLLQQESMCSPEIQSSRLVEASRLENRILMSASPMVAVAEAVSGETQLPEASQGPSEVLSDEQESPSDECVEASSQAAESNSECESTIGGDETSQQTAVTPGPELIVIDYRVQDADTLLEGLLSTDRDFRLLRLSADENGLSEITSRLQQIGNVSAVHLLTHGRAGEILLGSARLNASTLAQHAPELLAWQHSLTNDADLLLYGCDVAGTVEGQDFVESLSQLTNADVAASTNNTGSSVYGGDWRLEYRSGAIETDSLFLSTSTELSGFLLGVITVSTTDDVVDGDTSSVSSLLGYAGADGRISLREAIIATNNSAGADTIFLMAGTYSFTIGGRSENFAMTGDLDIRDTLTIIGAGSGLSIIDANGLDRVLHVQPGITAEVLDVTIRGGELSDAGWGGGVLVDSGASLNLSRSVITSNRTGSGAGIYNYGTLSAVDTVISNNNAERWGGGLYNDRGTVSLMNVTISGNFAGRDGGGINNSGSGSSMSLTNVTLSGNTALHKGGGIWTNRTVTAVNSTIAFNDASDGGGIYSHGGAAPVRLKNSILYNPAGVNANHGLVTLGHNIDSDGTAQLTGSGDLVADPLLAPLADYGGFTPTHALLAASPAIHAGTADGSPAKDQRGASRLGAVDIGAYEYTVIGYEPFSYSAGSFNGADGGSGWANGWSSVGSSTAITATGLQNPSTLMPVSGGSARLAIDSVPGNVTQTRNLATPIGSSASTTWLSFLLSPDSTVPGDYLGVRIGSSSETSIFAGYYGNAFLLERAGSSVIVSGITPFPGQTYFLTVKMEFLDGADTITLYVNSTPGLTEPDSLFTASRTDFDLGVFTEIGLSGGRLLLSNNARIDELRIGSTFPDVAPALATLANSAPVMTSHGGGLGAVVSVAENTSSVTTVTATDADLPVQSLTYLISGGADAARFTIDSSTGVLRFISPPDAESPADGDGDNVYEVIVQVSDGTLADSQLISVTVTDVNEFSVSAVSDINAVQNSVAENAANGTLVGITASAVDPDVSSNTVTYSLDDSAEGRFAVHAVTGVVTVADGTRLDRESAVSHNITIRATSSDGSSSAQTFAISLLPVNDNSPVIISNGGGSTAAISIPENTTLLTTVIATDADLPVQTLTYSIFGGTDAARFTINSSTGVLRFTSAPNFEAPTDGNRDNIYHVAVQASDGTRTDIQLLTVTVTDDNESPTVTGRFFQTTTDQSLTVSTPGLLSTAWDPEGDDLRVIILQNPMNGTLVSQPDGMFRYNPASGYSGRDHFQFAVSDGTHVSQAAAVSIDVLNAPAIVPISQIPESQGSATSSPSDSTSGTTFVTSTIPLTPDGTVSLVSTATVSLAANAKPGGTVSGNNQEHTEPSDVLISPEPGSDAIFSSWLTSSANMTSEPVSESAQASLTNSVHRTKTWDLTDRASADNTYLPDSVRREALCQLLSQDGQVWQELDSFHEQLSESGQIDAVVVGSVGVVGTGLSVGYLIWMVRFGTVLSGLLAQVPAWTMLDPLLIMDGQREDEDQESIQTIVDQKPSRSAGVRTASTKSTGNDYSANHRDESSDRC